MVLAKVGCGVVWGFAASLEEGGEWSSIWLIVFDRARSVTEGVLLRVK